MAQKIIVIVWVPILSIYDVKVTKEIRRLNYLMRDSNTHFNKVNVIIEQHFLRTEVKSDKHIDEDAKRDLNLEVH